MTRRLKTLAGLSVLAMFVVAWHDQAHQLLLLLKGIVIYFMAQLRERLLQAFHLLPSQGERLQFVLLDLLGGADHVFGCLDLGQLPFDFSVIN